MVPSRTDRATFRQWCPCSISRDLQCPLLHSIQRRLSLSGCQANGHWGSLIAPPPGSLLLCGRLLCISAHWQVKARSISLRQSQRFVLSLSSINCGRHLPQGGGGAKCGCGKRSSGAQQPPMSPFGLVHQRVMCLSAYGLLASGPPSRQHFYATEIDVDTLCTLMLLSRCPFHRRH